MQKVMIVDDDPDIQELLQRVLLDEGLQPIAASGSPRIGSLIARERPHLILLDLMMPEVDGWQVLELLQNQPPLAEIPVIVFTAAVHSLPDIQEFYGPAVTDYITKPFDLSDLLAKIHRHLPEPSAAEDDGSASATGL